LQFQEKKTLENNQENHLQEAHVSCNIY